MNLIFEEVVPIQKEKQHIDKEKMKLSKIVGNLLLSHFLVWYSTLVVGSRFLQHINANIP